jgi:hypothetical protein
VDEYKRPPRATKWGYGFMDVQPVAMTAEAQGASYDWGSEDAGGHLHSSFEPASGWLDD